MVLSAVAVAVGLGAGVLGGGRLAHIGDRPVRGWPLLAVGAVGHLVAVAADSAVVLAGALAALLFFAALNIRMVGMGVVAAGIGINLVAVAANDGMPVRPEALAAAGITDASDSRSVDVDGGRHLEERGERAGWLGDAIPLAPVREVVSFGDLVLAVGLADVAAHLTRPRPKRAVARRPRVVAAG